MPARPFTAAHKAALSKRMKARWAKARTQTTAQTNGLARVESRIVLTFHDQEYTLSVGEARNLREQLTAALVPTEPTHE